MLLSTAPWPGPGNSEGPVDPEGWVPAPVDDSGGADAEALGVPAAELLATDPWPGPGDSEGSRP